MDPLAWGSGTHKGNVLMDKALSSEFHSIMSIEHRSETRALECIKKKNLYAALFAVGSLSFPNPWVWKHRSSGMLGWEMLPHMLDQGQQ